MSQRFGDSTPVVKVELKRANPLEIVRGDRMLSVSGLVHALGDSLPASLSGALIRRYPDKVVLMQKDDPGDSLMLIISGEVRLFARRDRDNVELTTARVGEVVGECEVLSGQGKRCFTALAQGQVEVIDITRRALLQGEHLPRPLAAYLERVKLQRTRQLDELTDFMNRW